MVFSDIFNFDGECAPVCDEFTVQETDGNITQTHLYEECKTYVGYDNLYYKNFTEVYQFGKYWEVSCTTLLNTEVNDTGIGGGGVENETQNANQAIDFDLNISCEQCIVGEDAVYIDISADTVGSDRHCLNCSN